MKILKIKTELAEHAAQIGQKLHVDHNYAAEAPSKDATVNFFLYPFHIINIKSISALQKRKKIEISDKNSK